MVELHQVINAGNQLLVLEPPVEPELPSEKGLELLVVFSLAKLTTLLESPGCLRMLSPWKELLATFKGDKTGRISPNITFS